MNEVDLDTRSMIINLVKAMNRAGISEVPEFIQSSDMLSQVECDKWLFAIWTQGEVC